eukprot:351483-Chlamydomonas_euryale.AAC.4
MRGGPPGRCAAGWTASHTQAAAGAGVQLQVPVVRNGPGCLQASRVCPPAADVAVTLLARHRLDRGAVLLLY